MEELNGHEENPMSFRDQKEKTSCFAFGVRIFLAAVEVVTSTSYRDIRKKCISVITAIFWEVKYDRTFSCACAFSQPSQRLGERTVRRSCLRESCF